jgi:hypothetical protein
MLARAFVNSGWSAGNEDMQIRPGPHNPDGHFEFKPLVDGSESLLKEQGGAWYNPWALGDTKVDLGPVRRQLERDQREWGVTLLKDPRAMIFPGVIPKIRESEGKSIFLVRHPRSVAKSLRDRNGFKLSFGYKLWFEYHRRFLSSYRRDSCIVLHYEDILESPSQVARSLRDHIGPGIDPEHFLTSVVRLGKKPPRNRSSGLPSEILWSHLRKFPSGEPKTSTDLHSVLQLSRNGPIGPRSLLLGDGRNSARYIQWEKQAEMPRRFPVNRQTLLNLVTHVLRRGWKKLGSKQAPGRNYAR